MTSPTNSEPIEPQLPSEEENSSDSSDEEPIVPFLATREKRPNAGNRMRALLEHENIEQEEMFMEEEDDNEFEAKEEEDVFDSDFGSTDSGSGDEEDGEDAGERQLQREAKEARREAIGKKKKKVRTPFLPSFARQTKHQPKRPSLSATDGNAEASTSAQGLEAPPPKKKKKVNESIFSIMPRESSRKSAVAFKKTIEERLQESEQRRASLPKPKQKAAISLTQADLIMEALETEEINRASLLAFYAAEEDRRAADRIAGMRYEIVGPKITFLSRLEGDDGRELRGKGKGKGKGKEKEINEEGEREKVESGRRRLIEVLGEAGKEGWKPDIDVKEAAAAVEPKVGENGDAKREGESLATPAPEKEVGMEVDVEPTNATDIVMESTANENSTSLPPPISHVEPTTTTTTSPPLPLEPEPSTSTLPTALVPPSMPTPTSLSTDIEIPILAGTGEGGIEPHARNYLILDEFYGTKQQEMGAMFGNHCAWGSVKVVPTRSRVLNRKIPTCPLTGLPAPYRDPRTLTPYATISAYKTLQSVISQEYIWNDTLGAFTGSTKVGLGKEVEDKKGERKVKVREVVEKDASGSGSGGGKKEKETGEKEKEKEKGKEVEGANPYEKGYTTGSGGRAARRESKGFGVGGEVQTPSTPVPVPAPTPTPNGIFQGVVPA